MHCSFNSFVILLIFTNACFCVSCKYDIKPPHADITSSSPSISNAFKDVTEKCSNNLLSAFFNTKFDSLHVPTIGNAPCSTSGEADAFARNASFPIISAGATLTRTSNISVKKSASSQRRATNCPVVISHQHNAPTVLPRYAQAMKLFLFFSRFPSSVTVPAVTMRTIPLSTSLPF